MGGADESVSVCGARPHGAYADEGQDGQERYFGLTGQQWQVIRHSPAVEDAFMTDGWNLTVTGHDLPEDVQGVYATSNTFQFLGVPPVLGRGLLPSDAIDGHDPQPVAVLSYKFWQRHFNGNPDVVGKTMQLVHKNYTIVGVAAPRFTWNDAEVYLPLKVTQDPVPSYLTELRLKPGVSHAAAAAALTPLIHQFAKETPKHFPLDAFTFEIAGLNDDFIKQLGGTLALLFSAVALLLAIGCGNVSILLLARGTARQHELALRSAVGATRWRIVRQLLTESLLLSFTGAALGVLLAYKSVAMIVALLPQYSFPHEAAIQVNLPVLLFSVGVALFTGVVFGLWPALRLSRPDVRQVMQSGSRGVAGRLGGRATNNTLIAGQIALTLLMLAGAGAAIQGFLRMMHTPLGYDPHNIMSVGIPVHDGTYKTWGERSAYFEQLQKKVATVPGVTMTAISSNATPPSNGFPTHVEFLGKTAQDEQKVRVNFVSPTYFPVLRIPLAQGRIWDETENRNGAHLAVINQTMAQRYFPKGDAIGHSLKVPELQDQPPYNLAAPGGAGWLQIVGVVADKLDDGLRKPIKPEVFVPYTISMGMYTQILVRSEVSPLTLLHSVGAQVNSVDADQQINGQVQDLEHWITSQPEIQQETPGGVALRTVRRAGAGAGGGGAIQRGLLHRGAADERVRHPDGAGRAAGACAAHRLRIDAAERGLRDGGGAGADAFAAASSGALGGGQLTRSAGGGRGAAAEPGGGGGLCRSGAARLPSRPGAGSSLLGKADRAGKRHQPRRFTSPWQTYLAC